MEKAYEALRRGHVAAAVAPTAYGKTVASPWVWGSSRADGLAYGLVHVAPLRSLVRRAFEGVFRGVGGRLQAHGAPAGVRSPYLLSPLVVSTLDSFLWNLYRVPVAEALKVQSGVSMGHYYPALMAIYTSTIVLDEAHMYLWEDPQGGGAGAGWAASLAALWNLSAAGAPVLVETATVSPAMMRWLARAAGERGLRAAVLRAPGRGGGCPYIDSLRGVLGGALEEVADPDWEGGHLTPWETRVEQVKLEDLAGEITGEASRGPVLVVANTVAEAVRLYHAVEGRLPSGRAVLVHGRLSEEDRARAEEGIARVEAEGGVVVATQAAEAGVDVNAMAVYTAPAPLESLVQRAGRACRRGRILDACREEAGRVVVAAGSSRGPYRGDAVEPAVGVVANTISARGPRGLDWRATCNRGGVVSYASLLALARSGGSGAGPRAWGAAGRAMRLYLDGDAQPDRLLEMLDSLGLCGLARDTMMAEARVEGGVVVASLTWLLSHAREVLEAGHDGAPLVEVEYEGNTVVVEASTLWGAWERRAGCSRLLDALRRDISRALSSGPGGRPGVARARFLARPGAYRPGLGLLLPGELGG